MNWRRWPWLEEGALPLSILLLRLTWLWPWLLVFSRWTLPPDQRPILPLWAVAVLMFAGALASRLIPLDIDHPRNAQSWAAGLGVAAILLTLWLRIGRLNYPIWDIRWLVEQGYTMTHWGDEIPLAVMVAGLTAYLWLRGMQDSASPNHDDVWRAFGVGFVALALLLVVGRIDPGGLLPTMGRWIVLFFVVGMAALALAGLRLARSTRNASSRLPANRYWLGSIAAMITALIGGGLLLALFITPDAVARATGWVGTILGWIGTIVGWLLYGLIYLIFLVLTPIIYWLEENINFQLRFDVERLLEFGQSPLEDGQPQAIVELPAAVDESLRWIILLGVVAFVAVAFAGALHFLRNSGVEDEDELRENVLSQDLLREQASTLWNRWRDRFRGGGLPAMSPYLSLDDSEQVRRRIRAVYQAFLARMSADGMPRYPRQTPYRYARVFDEENSNLEQNLASLTDAYVAARYSLDPLTLEDAQAAESAWQLIDQALRAKAEDTRP